ncbi:MAG: P-loop NTPase, partial [Anaerolineales bacterium]
MELVDALRILAQRWWIIVLTAILVPVLVVLGAMFMQPEYAATATLRAATGIGTSILSLDFRYAERLANTYVEVAESRPLLDTVIATLGLNLSAEDLDRDIDVRVIPDTELIEITVRHNNPEWAAAIANALGTALIENASQLYAAGGRSAPEVITERLLETEAELTQLRSERDELLRDPEGAASVLEAKDRAIELREQARAFLLTQVQMAWMTEALRANAISFIEHAVPPADPEGPNLLVTGGVALAAGLLGGAALAFFLHNIDPGLRSPEDLKAMTDLPVLGVMPKVKRARGRNRAGIVIGSRKHPGSTAYRLLSTKVMAMCREHDLTSIMVTSAKAGEGKSIVAANLGAALAEAGSRTVLVESDFRSPVLHELFGVQNGHLGLSHMLASDGLESAPLRPGPVSGLRVLIRGDAPTDPVKAFASPAFRKLVELLAKNSDIVLYDAPPILQAP